MTTSLVTGADGFTGQYLVGALATAGHDVVGVARGPSAPQGLVACELTNREEVFSVVRNVHPEYVVHLAGLSFVGTNDLEAYYRVNLFGTLNLLEALASLRTRPAKVVIASSANVYGATSPGAIEESVCPSPTNHYANSKLAMEHMVRTWFDRLPLIIARPFNYTGPGQDERFVVPKIVSHFRRREASISLGDIDVRRDFSDVRDVVALYLALLDCDARSETVNICSEKGYSVREILSMAGDIAGYNIDVVADASLLRRNEIPILIGSNRKLRQMVRYKFRYRFWQTIQDMYLAPEDISA